MLILNRKVDEDIIIGDNIVVRYMGRVPNYPQQVRIGIDAPKDITISRREILKEGEAKAIKVTEVNGNA